MITEINGRKILSCRQAAELLGVTMGRVRQMALAGTLWYEHVGSRAIIFDDQQVRHLAKVRKLARDAGIVPGPRPGGFKADVKKKKPRRVG